MVTLGDGNQNSSHELLEAQAHIWNHIFNFINPMSLKCAIQLEIPDIIHSHGKPITLPELINSLPIHPTKSHCIPRLMRILVHSGFFAKENFKENDSQELLEGYVLTDSSKLLLKDNPLSVTPFLLSTLDPILMKPWHYLSTWFLNNDPAPFDTAHGERFWECAGREPRLNNFFNEAMASDARLIMDVIIKDSNNKGMFDGLKSLVDVGGGTGTVAKALADAFPDLSCIVFDLPHVVAGLEDFDNLKFVGGDMFEEIPDADAILLKWILHDWNDEKCLKILQRCNEAIKGRKGGKLIIIDMVIENQKECNDSIGTKFCFDMLMMVLFFGKERNKNEWEKLFFEAGFSDYKITRELGLRSIIEVYP